MTILSALFDQSLYGIPSTDQLPISISPPPVSGYINSSYNSPPPTVTPPGPTHGVKLQILNVFEAAQIAPFSPNCPTIVSVEASFQEGEMPIPFLQRVACIVKDSDQFSDNLGHAILRLLYIGAFNLSFDMGAYRKDTKPLTGAEVPANRMAIVRMRPAHSLYLHGSGFTKTANITDEVVRLVTQTTVRVDNVQNGVTTTSELLTRFVDAVPPPAKAVVEDYFRRGLFYLPVEEDYPPYDMHTLQASVPGQDVVLSFTHSETICIEKRLGPTVMSYLRALNNLRLKGKLAKGLKLADALLSILEKHQCALPHWKMLILTVRSHMYLDGKQYALAAAALTDTLPLCKKQEQLSRTLKMGIWLNDARDYHGASGHFNSYLALNNSLPGESATPEQLTEVKLRLGGAMYMAGQLSEQQAVEMIQNTLKGDLTNDVGVSLMVRFYTGRKLASDALSWAVQLLIRNHSSPESWRYNELAGWVMRNFGPTVTLTTLMQLLPRGKGGVEMASAIGHLALVAKDNGLIDVAIGLYEWCCDMSPVPSLVLNLAHVYETANRPLQSLKVLQQSFLGPLKDVVVGGVSCFTIGQLIGDLSSVDGKYPVPKDLCLKRLNKRHRCLRVVAGTDTLQGFATAEEAQQHPRGAFKERPFQQTASVTYTEVELFILGMFFTVCKDMYVLGLFDKLLEVVLVVNPVRFNAALHLTLIRNEAAYFSTVALMMQHHDGRLANSPAVQCEDMLYVVGDSHSFAPAWQLITLHKKRVLLNTSIVTGLKIWHLREESEFFPKKTFELVLGKIPAKSNVMFVVGEIDCREGIPRSVDRGIYPSLERATEVIVELYVKILLQIRSKYDFGNIYVHAPPAGLELTRHIVLGMHKIMQRLLRPLASQKIYFVNPELTETLRIPATPNVGILHDVKKVVVKAPYVLDHMHISPAYVQDLLAPAIENAALNALKEPEPSDDAANDDDVPPPAVVAKAKAGGEGLLDDDDDDMPPPVEAV